MMERILPIGRMALYPLTVGVEFLYTNPRLRAVNAASAREQTLSLR